MRERFDDNDARRGWAIWIRLWLFAQLSLYITVYKIFLFRTPIWSWIVISLGLVSAWLRYERWLRRTYRCPTCGKGLGPPGIEKWDPGDNTSIPVRIAGSSGR